MLKFRTPIQLDPFFNQISYSDRVFTLGSCFAEQISTRLQYMLYTVYSNPNGVLYNPDSLRQCISMSLDEYKFSVNDLVEDHGISHSLFHHSSHSGTDPEIVLQQIQNIQQQCKEEIINADWIIITFGTSWAYRYKKTRHVVSNCHRIPATQFDREWLNFENCLSNYQSLINQIRDQNPKAKFIFTVSPIRHLKDGLVENQRSKSNLILLCSELSKIECCYYFPAYEIMMDDLRDYRFYDRDLCHPNDQAVDYVWQLFSEYVLNKSELILRKEVEQIVDAAAHKPRFKNSAHHAELCRRMIKRLHRLEGRVNEKIRLELVNQFSQVNR